MIAVTAIVATSPPSSAAGGRVTITGTNGAITDGYPYGGAAEAEFWVRCREQLAASTIASGGPAPVDTGSSAVPVSNGLGAYVIDLGAAKTGTFSATATIAPTTVGPRLPDPSGRVFPSGGYQAYNYDLDIHFVTTGCDDAGSAQTQTQNPNEVGGPANPARYMIIVLASNLTGSPSVTVDYTTP